MRLDRALPLISLFATSLAAGVGIQGCGSSDVSDNDTPATGGLAPATGGDATGGEPMATGGQGGEMPGTGGVAATGGTTSFGLPELLSETELYQADMQTLAEGVRPFRPQFPLWTDGAEKRRWIKLPDGQKIDTSNMNYWSYPVGTKLWKEFSRDGTRVETRLISKRREGVWDMVAYQWRDDMSDADAVPEGVADASGTPHDIPSQEQCWECHNQVTDRVIGFSAVQLSHQGAMTIPGMPQENEWNMDALIAAQLLTAPPAAPLVLVGSDEQKAAFGYMHANCGHCHHPGSGVSGRVNMQLWLKAEEVFDLSTAASTVTTVSTLVSLPEDTAPGATHRVMPDDLSLSAVYQRFNSRGEKYSMPPLGTEEIDPAGEQAIRAWIESLAPPP